jgi:uncharacterized protein (TIGR03435 family)
MKRPAALMVTAAGLLWAQGERTFEAVSIKPNRSGADRSETDTSPGRLSLVNVTPLSLILRAFGVQASQVVQAPGWVATERYDVVAVTGGADRLTDLERQPFIQSMLAERWKFRYHRETRPLNVYSLTAAKGEPKLAAYAGAGQYGMKLAGTPGKLTLVSTKGNIPRLVEILSGQTGRIVQDDTGLTGEYNFTLEWATEGGDASGPSLFTALQEQLGLKLETVRRPVEVIVIDQIDRPSEN